MSEEQNQIGSAHSASCPHFYLSLNTRQLLNRCSKANNVSRTANSSVRETELWHTAPREYHPGDAINDVRVDLLRSSTFLPVAAPQSLNAAVREEQWNPLHPGLEWALTLMCEARSASQFIMVVGKYRSWESSAKMPGRLDEINPSAEEKMNHAQPVLALRVSSFVNKTKRKETNAGKSCAAAE
jgi:hypothetical protein